MVIDRAPPNLSPTPRMHGKGLPQIGGGVPLRLQPRDRCSVAGSASPVCASDGGMSAAASDRS